MLEAHELLSIQRLKLNIATFLTENISLENSNIVFTPVINNEITEKEWLTVIYQYIESCVTDTNYNKYSQLINKFLTDTNFLTLFFNNEIDKTTFLVLTQFNQNFSSYENKITFLQTNQNILKSFKNITFTQENLICLLGYISKFLLICQSLSYVSIVEYADILNNIYQDAEFFINKKSAVGLE